MTQLEEKTNKWIKLFDEITELVGQNTVGFDRNIECFYKLAPNSYQITSVKEIKVSDDLITKDLIIITENKLKQQNKIILSRNYENKTYGQIANPEMLLIKIKAYIIKKNKQELENFASLEL